MPPPIQLVELSKKLSALRSARDLVWRDGQWEVNPEQIHETGTKRHPSVAQREKTPFALAGTLSSTASAGASNERSVQAAYRILLTRPIKGLYLRFEDKETMNHTFAILAALCRPNHQKTTTKLGYEILSEFLS